MRYEKPQAQNPNQITVNQHVLPSRSIERFARNGAVEVQRVGTKDRFLAQPSNAVFCARRVWDQKAERLSKPIEDRFQAIVEQVLNQPHTPLEKRESLLVTEFYALVLTRARFRDNPIAPRRLIGIKPGQGFSKDEQEKLEHAGVTTLDSDGLLPGRSIVGMHFWSQYARYRDGYKYLAWNVATCTDGEIIVPDTLIRQGFIPLTPSILLSAEGYGGLVSRPALISFNQRSMASSKTYCFASRFASCPIR